MNAVMDGYFLFSKDRLVRQGGGIVLCLREELECIELHLETNDGELVVEN